MARESSGQELREGGERSLGGQKTQLLPREKKKRAGRKRELYWESRLLRKKTKEVERKA